MPKSKLTPEQIKLLEGEKKKNENDFKAFINPNSTYDPERMKRLNEMVNHELFTGMRKDASSETLYHLYQLFYLHKLDELIAKNETDNAIALVSEIFEAHIVTDQDMINYLYEQINNARSQLQLQQLWQMIVGLPKAISDYDDLIIQMDARKKYIRKQEKLQQALPSMSMAQRAAIIANKENTEELVKAAEELQAKVTAAMPVYEAGGAKDLSKEELKTALAALQASASIVLVDPVNKAIQVEVDIRRHDKIVQLYAAQQSIMSASDPMTIITYNFSVLEALGVLLKQAKESGLTSSIYYATLRDSASVFVQQTLYLYCFELANIPVNISKPGFVLNDVCSRIKDSLLETLPEDIRQQFATVAKFATLMQLVCTPRDFSKVPFADALRDVSQIFKLHSELERFFVLNKIKADFIVLYMFKFVEHALLAPYIKEVKTADISGLLAALDAKALEQAKQAGRTQPEFLPSSKVPAKPTARRYSSRGTSTEDKSIVEDLAKMLSSKPDPATLLGYILPLVYIEYVLFRTYGGTIDPIQASSTPDHELQIIPKFEVLSKLLLALQQLYVQSLEEKQLNQYHQQLRAKYTDVRVDLRSESEAVAKTTDRTRWSKEEKEANPYVPQTDKTPKVKAQLMAKIREHHENMILIAEKELDKYRIAPLADTMQSFSTPEASKGKINDLGPPKHPSKHG